MKRYTFKQVKKVVVRKMWTFIESDTGMSEQSKKAMINIHNSELGDILKEIEKL